MDEQRNDYEKAIIAAGAEVVVFEHFGSYQGDWFALVEYKGQRGWVHGVFGSCSACDAFSGEFDLVADCCKAHIFFSDAERDDCGACVAANAAYRSRLADFGRQYLDDMLTQEQIEKIADEHHIWDSEVASMMEFLRRNAIR